MSIPIMLHISYVAAFYRHYSCTSVFPLFFSSPKCLNMRIIFAMLKIYQQQIWNISLKHSAPACQLCAAHQVVLPVAINRLKSQHSFAVQQTIHQLFMTSLRWFMTPQEHLVLDVLSRTRRLLKTETTIVCFIWSQSSPRSPLICHVTQLLRQGWNRKVR